MPSAASTQPGGACRWLLGVCWHAQIDIRSSCRWNQALSQAVPAGGFSVFAGVGERTREGNDLYKEMIESVSPCPSMHDPLCQ